MVEFPPPWYVYGYKTNGTWATGWKLIDGEWYFFSQYGYMFDATYHESFQIIGGYTYQFKPKGGIVKNSGWKVAGSDGSEWAYWMPGVFGAVTTWTKINGLWYNFKPNGYLYKNEGWYKVKGKWMYFVSKN